MTNEAQRIAAAEWEGWKVRHGTELDGPCGKDDFLWTSWTAPDGKEYGDTPDYSQDLNAMWRLEEKLDAGQFHAYTCNLISQFKHGNRAVYDLHRNLIHATAAQRLEALLRTVGLWKE